MSVRSLVFSLAAVAVIIAVPASASGFELNFEGLSHLCWFSHRPASDWYVRHDSPFHAGDDKYADDWNLTEGAALDCGEPVYSSCAGNVIYTGDANNGYGNQVVIRCAADPGFVVRVAHLQSIIVSNGQAVTHADTLGEVGATGTATGCHLHLVLYQNILDGSAALTRLMGGHTPSGPLQGPASGFAAKFYPDDYSC